MVYALTSLAEERRSDRAGGYNVAGETEGFQALPPLPPVLDRIGWRVTVDVRHYRVAPSAYADHLDPRHARDLVYFY